MRDPHPTPAPASERERRALDWVRGLAELPERCAGSASERLAAERLAEWLRKLGVSEVSLQRHEARPRTGLVLALHAGVALLGLLWGGVAGVLLAALAAYSFQAELRARPQAALLSRLLPRAIATSVVGRAGSSAPARRVVLSAHIDAAQAGFIFSRTLADFFARGARAGRRGSRLPVGPHAIPEALLLAAALLALAGWLGAGGFLFGLLATLDGVGLVLTALAGVEWAFAPASPGANDNASAVAALLTCAEQVLARLPSDVELWLVGTGAEEVGCCGMHAFVEGRADWPAERSFFLNFECVGGGHLHWIRSEGTLAKSGYPPLLLELARRVAAGGGFGEVTPTDLLAGTDGHVPADHGFPALSLISLEPSGVPRNYHRPEDTVEGIDAATLVRSADFGAAVVRAALEGAAGPIDLV